MSFDLLTFDEALSDSSQVAAEPHLLLGNGFSISCRPNSFNYGALLDEATFDAAHGDIRAVFELLGTTDFERVIEMLRVASALVDCYGSRSDLGNRLRHDAETVREALAVTLAARHPDLPFDLAPAEYTAARNFLSNFRKIYTLNYDMLLYWAVMQDFEPNLSTNDGFTNSEDPSADYVVWEPYLDFGSQTLFFLHGGLHLYDSGPEISKITWSRTGIPLVDQIRTALATGRYPLIVTEGSSAEKEAKILHNPYLDHAIRSFAKIQKTLFIHGHSLAPNDEHIFRCIEKGKLDRLYISIHGDLDSEVNRATVLRGQALMTNRERYNGSPLEVRFYDASTAHVWG
ncbi:MAG: DUF4917 family protein [Acidimicrobiia bacterium]